MSSIQPADKVPAILGYQVQNADGENWGDRPSFEILTAETAIADLQAARRLSDGLWLMVAILDGDIEEPTFEDQAQVDRMTSAVASPRALNALCWVRQTTFPEDLKRGLRSITNDSALGKDISDAFRFTSHKDIVRFYEDYAYAPGNTQWQLALAEYISTRIASYDVYSACSESS